MFRWLSRGWLVFLVLLPTFIGGAQQAEDGVTTYTEALVGSVTRLNPLLAHLNPAEQDITSLIYEGLTRINQHGEPQPLLAREWVVSADGLDYVFRLRRDVLWHDGTLFTADDVVYTYTLLSDPAFPGAEQVGRFWRTVEVQKLADDLVRFRLTQPLASFPTALTLGIVPEHALRGTTAAGLARHPFNLSPVGTGPYQLEALRGAQRIEAVDLRVAPVYGQRPDGKEPFAMQRVRFLLAETFEAARDAVARGAADGLAARTMAQRPAVVDLPGTRPYTAIAPAVGMLIFNWDEGEDVRFFREGRVREALRRSVNTASPVERHLGNQAVVANSPLLPESWAYTDLEWGAPDTLAAFQLLDSARIETPSMADDSSDVFHRFDLIVPDNPALAGIAQELAAQWQPAGLAVTVVSLPADVYRQRLDDGDFGAAIVELPLGADPDVYAYWHVGQHPDGMNYGGAADDRLSETLERARGEISGINRAQLYEQFQQQFVEYSIALPLYYPLFTYAVDEAIDGVQLGFISSPEDRFRTLGQWHYAG